MPLHHTLANVLHRARRTLRRVWAAVRPDAHAWRGAAWGALAVLVVFAIFFREPKKAVA